MTLVEQINQMYNQAKAEIQRTIDSGPQSPQAKYDLKKARRMGREPKKYTAGLEKMRHEMDHERRWVLKGVQMTLDFLSQVYLVRDGCPERLDDETLAFIEEVIGNVQDALDEGGEATSEAED